ncbi:choice-of-anchor Q domain-containing protein [Leucobacter albus]|uniref:Choice-of-anchor Q domain-containing protein n=1 Tax=Leucobacter albus TaxID=272210 RepID=A0ABW3TR25_9MICO
MVVMPVGLHQFEGDPWHTGAFGAIGVGLALAAVSAVPAQAAPPAALAQAPAALDCAVVPDPGGAVYEVTASGDAGAGTFADAVAQANASPGVDTIRFAPGVTIEATKTVELTESIVIDGAGSTLQWAPESDETESWLSGAEVATVAAYNLAITQTAPNWEPIIFIESSPADVDTVLCNVTATGSSEGLLQLEESFSDFIGQQVTVDGSSGEAELAAIWIGHAEGSVTLRDSTFKNLDMGGLTIEYAELSPDDAVTVASSEFRDINVEEAESAGLALSINSIESATGEARSAPAVSVVDTVLADIAGFADAAAYISDVDGDVSVERTHVSGVKNPDGYLHAAMTIDSVNGGVLVSDSSFSENEATGLVLGYIEPGADQQIRVERSLFERNAVLEGGVAGGLNLTVDAPGSRTTPLVEIVDSAFLDNTGNGYSGAAIDASLDGVYEDPVVRLTGNTFRIGQPDAEGNLGMPLFVEPIGNSLGEDLPQPVLALLNNTVDVGAAWPAGDPGIMIDSEGSTSVIEHLTMPGAPVLFQGEDVALTVNYSALGDATSGGVISENGETIEGVENTVPASGALAAAGADIVPLADWGLAPLADNGGPLVGMASQQLTMLPSAESPLVDAAATSNAAADQRGVTRPQGEARDRGAVEVEAIVELGEVAMGPDVSVKAGESAVLTVTRSAPTDEAATATVKLTDGTAIAGADYEAATYTVEWVAGDTTPKKVTVKTQQNKPGTRNLTATITEATGATIGARATATVTITQEDATVPPTKPAPPGDQHLSDTGGTGPGWGLGVGLAALLLGIAVAALALRGRGRGARESS